MSGSTEGISPLCGREDVNAPDLGPANYPAEPPPVNLDDLTPEPCGCCGWIDWWRNPDCVQSQPPEFVIDDARPGVLRAPRPDDFRWGDDG